MSIYSVIILSVCLSVMLQKALLIMDVFILNSLATIKFSPFFRNSVKVISFNHSTQYETMSAIPNKTNSKLCTMIIPIKQKKTLLVENKNAQITMIIIFMKMSQNDFLFSFLLYLGWFMLFKNIIVLIIQNIPNPILLVAHLNSY